MYMYIYVYLYCHYLNIISPTCISNGHMSWCTFTLPSTLPPSFPLQLHPATLRASLSARLPSPTPANRSAFARYPLHPPHKGGTPTSSNANEMGDGMGWDGLPYFLCVRWQGTNLHPYTVIDVYITCAIHVCMYACVYVWIHACMRVCIGMRVWVHTQVYKNMCGSVCSLVDGRVYVSILKKWQRERWLCKYMSIPRDMLVSVYPYIERYM